MSPQMDKPVILIGGTAGTGKSRLAHELCSHLAIDHRLGTGFIREIVKSQYSAAACPELHSFTFRSERPIDNLVAQARRLHGAVMACIERARNEGTSIVIEGNHLIPELYCNSQVDLFVVLSAPAPEEHLRRLRGPSHLKRHLSADDFNNVRRIDEWLRSEALGHGVPYRPYAENLADFAPILQSKLDGYAH
jgi:2-phosphoglycerate kinase